MKRVFVFFISLLLCFVLGFTGADIVQDLLMKKVVTEKEDGLDGGNGAEDSAPGGVAQADSAQASEQIDMRLVTNEFSGVASEYVPLEIIAAESTSTIDQEGVDNSAMMLFDGRDDTSWQEGVEGYGIGERVRATFSDIRQIHYMSFKLGNWKSEEYYIGNAKPKTITVTCYDRSGQEVFHGTVTFENEQKVEWIEFSRDIEAYQFEITIDDIYEGSSWQDTCISEITLYGK